MDIMLTGIIIALIVYNAYMQRLHHAEIRGLLKNIGIEIEEKPAKKYKATNKFKTITEQFEGKGGE